MSTNFHLAPPAKTVDGLLAVPVDIQSINASMTFDGGSSTATVDATIDFIMGGQNGNPIFDLRQTIVNAWLDGAGFPVANLAHHDFGGGAGSELRILESLLAAGSGHTLRLTYNLGLPQASTAGGYPPGLSWVAGPRLAFNFGFTDLGPGRYLESWLPANLIYDQFDLNLEIELINTTVAHTLITNGDVTTIGTNHWTVAFPSRFTALSTLLEIRADDTIVFQSGSITLPVSGRTITIETYKLLTDATDLTVSINNIKTFLTDNENDYGPYIHGNRFVAIFKQGGMEYEGGTTAVTSSIRHETFHSWFARGLKPASQPDGWWDEAYTTYHDGGALNSTAFDFTAPKSELCTQNPWSRITPSGSPSAYIDGERFWRGVSAEIGNPNLRGLVRSLYNDKYASLVRTSDIEEYLVSKSGSSKLVDAFHRFVYGFDDPSPLPNIWIKDDVSDPGGDYWAGNFWNSPDLWIRNANDDGTVHQNPEFGQDNWFYARVRNNGPGTVNHFLTSFNAKSYLGTEFIYPGDFLPAVNAATRFNLAASSSMVVKAKWPAVNVPPAGTHCCLLAAIIARGCHPASGVHVWEDNNLAQKNLAIVDLIAGDFVIIPVRISNFQFRKPRRFKIEIKKNKDFPSEFLSLIHEPAIIGRKEKIHSIPIHEYFATKQRKGHVLDCGGHEFTTSVADTNMITSGNVDSFARFRPSAIVTELPSRKVPSILTELKPNDQALVGLKIQLPKDAKKGSLHRFDLIQRDDRTNKIIGGVAIEVRVKKLKN